MSCGVTQPDRADSAGRSVRLGATSPVDYSWTHPHRLAPPAGVSVVVAIGGGVGIIGIIAVASAVIFAGWSLAAALFASGGGGAAGGGAPCGHGRPRR